MEKNCSLKQVAVWGPNRWCNFGDDLQSIVFALHIRSLGYEPIVFQLDESVAEEYDLTVADTVDELLSEVKLCIIAGGALLTPLHPLKQLLKKDFRMYEKDFGELHRGAKKYGTKFCAISMGVMGKHAIPGFGIPFSEIFFSDQIISSMGPCDSKEISSR